MMIGIIPSSNKTFEVYGSLSDKNLIEGKLYYDEEENGGRVYFYSTTETRSNPRTGYYPIWNGKDKFVSSFSNEKYLWKDVIKIDTASMSSTINKDVADKVLYMQRKSENDEILKPAISDEDNMFTQCIKGIITAMNITMIDLVDMTSPSLQEKIVEGYYNSLNKITFMRFDKWNIWIDVILHVKYSVEVFKGEKRLVKYDYPSNKFDTGIVKYDQITSSKDDQFKKIIKIIMIIENINKNSLRSSEVDDYTINNMMTTLSGTKPLSAQLFSRFIRMAGLNYTIKIFKDDKEIFEYHE